MSDSFYPVNGKFTTFLFPKKLFDFFVLIDIGTGNDFNESEDLNQKLFS